uniref:Uncharacterized protein n=1 Tax=Onchocerca volvulus TaxID=6282 RepID=A0A8R1U0P0_ONCVO
MSYQQVTIRKREKFLIKPEVIHYKRNKRLEATFCQICSEKKEKTLMQITILYFSNKLYITLANNDNDRKKKIEKVRNKVKYMYDLLTNALCLKLSKPMSKMDRIRPDQIGLDDFIYLQMLAYDMRISHLHIPFTKFNSIKELNSLTVDYKLVK